ncbi:MAG: ThiF family adenylyltransferase [Candidatus Thorarchaeota archaeon]|jgi:hypothetical protein
MFEKICVIGLGSLGSFLCKHLSELDQVKHLVTIDPDFVEVKNLATSMFKKTDVGDSKVNAVFRFASNNVEVTKIHEKYEEGITKLPKCDLVIDCRDIICTRKKEIDMKLYISENFLVINCKKNVYCNNPIPGRYLINLMKDEINTAAFFATRIINSEQIYTLLKNQLVQTVDINSLIPAVKEDIQGILQNREDMICDAYKGSERLIQIEENLKPIYTKNKKQDIEIVIGGLENTRSIIPKDSLNIPVDVIPKLLQLIEKDDSSYVVRFERRVNEFCIHLIKEYGGA